MTSPTMFTNTTLRSKTFSCPSCLAEITVRLGDLDGVESVEVAFPSAHILIIHDPVTVTVDDLVDVVADTDHTATAPIMPAA